MMGLATAFTLGFTMVSVASGSNSSRFLQSFTKPVGLQIINNCDEDIDLRTRVDLPGDDDSDGRYQTIPAHQSLSFDAGKVINNKVVLAWKDAANVACYNGVFCTQIELTSDPQKSLLSSNHPNFVNQLAFSDMQIGAAFYKNGQPHTECPQAIAAKCKENKDWCTSNRGKFDKCMHSADTCSKDVGWKVKLDKNSRHSYCLSPDVNKAIISEDMRNPSKAECAQQPKDKSRWICRGNCKDLTGSPTGTTDSLCGPRWDMVFAMRKEGLKLFDADGELAPEAIINDNTFGGAKPYQTVVNQACGNQAPTQRAETGTDGTIGEEWVPDYDRSYKKQGHLDHAITWEGDDINKWELQVQKYPNRGLFMAGSGGMQCDNVDWDTFVIKACPAKDE
jgi:hypothetical protein